LKKKNPWPRVKASALNRITAAGPGVLEVMTKKWKQNGDGSHGKTLAVFWRSGEKGRRIKWE